jgi:hypothetical protein
MMNFYKKTYGGSNGSHKNKQEQQKRAQQSAQGLSSFLLKAKWF